MKNSIFRSICLTVFSALALVLILITGVLYNYFASVQQRGMRMQTELIAKAVEDEGTAFFDRLEQENYRITYIGSDGNVIYDSHEGTESLKNHLDREEVREALAQGYGESFRYSDTLLEKRYYSAKKLNDGSIIRLSSGHLTMLSLLLTMVPYVIAVSISAVAISLLLASRLSRNIVKPLNELNLDRPKDNDAYEELFPLLERIDSQQKQLKSQAAQLRHKQEEFNAATGNMQEGLILLNDAGTVLSINRMASRLFSLDETCVGQNIFTVSPDLMIEEQVVLAQGGESSEVKVEINGMEYQINTGPVISDEKVAGVAVLIFDITEKERAEQMRREFTSNVSHELKTPLHAISGYAELLKDGIVKEEDMGHFAARIYSEAQRLIGLVEDIIKLSHLDEGVGNLPWEEADLYELAGNTLAVLSSQAEEAGVFMSLKGSHVRLFCCSQMVEVILFNLCDNAIKYHHEKGSVVVYIEENDTSVILSVGDSGIGIPPEDHERIFERFYRVDKSHSKEVGGTGLGLSIVKHAVRMHGGQILVDSKVGYGTVIKVVFPKKAAEGSVL